MKPHSTLKGLREETKSGYWTAIDTEIVIRIHPDIFFFIEIIISLYMLLTLLMLGIEKMKIICSEWQPKLLVPVKTDIVTTILIHM
jgi:hypothetical protein